MHFLYAHNTAVMPPPALHSVFGPPLAVVGASREVIKLLMSQSGLNGEKNIGVFFNTVQHIVDEAHRSEPRVAKEMLSNLAVVMMDDMAATPVAGGETRRLAERLGLHLTTMRAALQGVVGSTAQDMRFAVRSIKESALWVALNRYVRRTSTVTAAGMAYVSACAARWLNESAEWVQDNAEVQWALIRTSGESVVRSAARAMRESAQATARDLLDYIDANARVVADRTTRAVRAVRDAAQQVYDDREEGYAALQLALNALAAATQRGAAITADRVAIMAIAAKAQLLLAAAAASERASAAVAATEPARARAFAAAMDAKESIRARAARDHPARYAENERANNELREVERRMLQRVVPLVYTPEAVERMMALYMDAVEHIIGAFSVMDNLVLVARSIITDILVNLQAMASAAVKLAVTLATTYGPPAMRVVKALVEAAARAGQTLVVMAKKAAIETFSKSSFMQEMQAAAADEISTPADAAAHIFEPPGTPVALPAAEDALAFISANIVL